MQRSDYPGLLQSPERIHCDVSAAFPIHKDVIAAANEAMMLVGTPQKGMYESARDANDIVEETRQAVAKLIGADPDEVFFCSSATSAAREVVRQMAHECSAIIYSPEDHTSNIHAAQAASVPLVPVYYTQQGKYSTHNLKPEAANGALFLATHVHQLYGAHTGYGRIIDAVQPKITALDISQSVSRTLIALHNMPVDIAYFSAQKVGGIAGLGVLYVRRELQRCISNISHIEPHTLSVPLVAALKAAVAILQAKGPMRCYSYLADTTSDIVIPGLAAIPDVELAKGTTMNDNACDGYGIVSFSVNGYTAQEIGMILDDEGISVRAGDHCIDTQHVTNNLVRLSWHVFTSPGELRRIIATIATL